MPGGGAGAVVLKLLTAGVEAEADWVLSFLARDIAGLRCSGTLKTAAVGVADEGVAACGGGGVGAGNCGGVGGLGGSGRRM